MADFSQPSPFSYYDAGSGMGPRYIGDAPNDPERNELFNRFKESEPLTNLPIDLASGMFGGLAIGNLTKNSSNLFNQLSKPTKPTLPSEGFVHGAPISTLPQYLKEGIPHGSTEEGQGLSFVGRLDHPAGYQASMTAAGGFGPMSKFSRELSSRMPVGRERFNERVAYTLDPKTRVIPKNMFDQLDDLVEAHPEYIKITQNRNVIPKVEMDSLHSRIRDDIFSKLMAGTSRPVTSYSHRMLPELAGTEDISAKLATPSQITGLVYDGPLQNIYKHAQQAGKRVFDSNGALRYDPTR